MLAKYVSTRQDDWDQYLGFIALAYNASVHKATQETPFFLMHGFDCRLPSEFPLEVTNPNYVDSQNYALLLANEMPKIWELVRGNLEVYKNRMRQQYNRNVNPVPFQKGHIVRLWVPITTKGRSSKLGKHWHGPYRITEIANNIAYIVPLNQPERKSKPVHVNRIKMASGPYVPKLLTHKEITEQGEDGMATFEKHSGSDANRSESLIQNDLTQNKLEEAAENETPKTQNRYDLRPRRK